MGRLRVVTWNVNGLEALLTHRRPGQFQELLEDLGHPDILCLQEVKSTRLRISGLRLDAVEGYEAYFSFPAHRPSYSGVVTLCKRERCAPFEAWEGFAWLNSHLPPGESVRLDPEGRLLLTDHSEFLLLNGYFPSVSSSEDPAHPRLKYKLECVLL